MAQYASTLDSVFLALSDPTRRAVLGRLGAGPATVSELASGFAMALPSFLKHVRALEGSGLIHTSKTGRVRTCELDRDRLAVVDGWLAEQRSSWDRHTDRLEEHLSKEEGIR
jgi:DNA-binding transcriptional ArsR family regulator